MDLPGQDVPQVEACLGEAYLVSVGAGANLLSFGRFQNVDGIGAGLGWFQR